MLRRIGASEEDLLVVQTNLANTYANSGRLEQALKIARDVYSGRMMLNGEEHRQTLVAKTNYASSLVGLQRFEEAKSLLRKTMLVARRVLGKFDHLTIRMKM
jgi:hypothetical protein